MPSLKELISVVREASNHEPDTMVTLAFRSDDKKWVQILADKINLAYPFDKPPCEQFTELEIPNAKSAAAGFWEPQLFADFETSAMSIEELSNFLTAYLVTAFGTADLDEFAVSFELAERGTIVADSDNDFLRKIVELTRYFDGRSAHRP